MKLLRLLLITVSLLLVLPAARAQWLTAEDFFNDGAHSYLSNNIPQALQSVQTGLQRYPDDVKLQKLEQLLKQQQQQQQNQNQQNQDQKNQQSKDNKNSQSQNSKDQKDQPPQQNSQSQPNQQGQNKPDQGQQKNAADKNQEEQKAGETNGAPQAVAAGQMTPEEAKHLLDAQKGNEQVLQMKPAGKPQDDSHPVKDW